MGMDTDAQEPVESREPFGATELAADCSEAIGCGDCHPDAVCSSNGCCQFDDLLTALSKDEEDVPVLWQKKHPLNAPPTDTGVTPNRLSNVRWEVGGEPYADVPGTDEGDGWVNVKLEVTENPPPDPNQKDQLSRGPELRMKCTHCGTPLYLSGTKKAKEALEEGGYKVREDAKHQDELVAACLCENGHATQLVYTLAVGLIKRDV